MILRESWWWGWDEGEHFENECEFEMRVDLLLDDRSQPRWELFQRDVGRLVLLTLLPLNEAILRVSVVVYKLLNVLLRPVY